jgi:hypothetical protein
MVVSGSVGDDAISAKPNSKFGQVDCPAFMGIRIMTGQFQQFNQPFRRQILRKSCSTSAKLLP